jgi:hypothetical protein
MTRQELIQELMQDSQTYCCYCGTPKVRFSCCGENHFETFAEMNKETQESILSDMASEVSDFWEGYVPEPDSTCNNTLRAQGKAYPRTCKKCGLGPCVGLAQQALDKKAENARELGLDYEPQRWAVFCQGCRKEWSVSYPHPGKSICADCDDKLAQYSGIVSDGGLDPRNKFDKSAQDSGIVTAGGFDPRTQRPWVGLTDEEIEDCIEMSIQKTCRAIEAKLKEKNGL